MELATWILECQISVPKTSESETALFPAKNSQTRHHNFPPKKMTPSYFYGIFMWQFFPDQLKTGKKIIFTPNIWKTGNSPPQKIFPATLKFQTATNPPLLGTLCQMSTECLIILNSKAHLIWPKSAQKGAQIFPSQKCYIFG